MAINTDLIRLLSQGGPAEIVQAGQQGFQQGAEHDQEAKLAELKQRIDQAKLISNKSLGEAPASLGLNLPPEGEVGTQLGTDILNNITKLRAQTTKPTLGGAPLTPEAIEALGTQIDLKDPTSGAAFRQSAGTLSAEKASQLAARYMGIASGNANIKGQPARTALGKELSPLPTPVTEQTDALRDIAFNLQTLNGKFKPEYVGPSAGRIGSLEQTTGLGASPDATAFYQAAAGLQNAILKARSGGAVTVGEAGRLLQEVPNKNSKDFAGRLQRTTDIFNQMIQAKNKAYGSYSDYTPINPVNSQPTTPVAAANTTGLPTREDIAAERARRARH